MTTRRQLLKAGLMAGAGMLVPWGKFAGRALADPLPGGTLDPLGIPKYAHPLVIPPAMPRTGKIVRRGAKNIDYYEIAVRQFQQQILPPGLPQTTVWSYGSVNHPGSFNYPAFTLEAKWNAPLRVKWINDLKDPLTGTYLSHLLPVDQTLHWANPPGGTAGRDMNGDDPSPYVGPVPIVTHVHGAHTTEESDGYTEAWYLPAAGNIPGSFAAVGSKYNDFKAAFEAAWGQPWTPGSAVFQYANDQRATTLWYHDHSLGMTRLNVYAGPAGFYILRGGPDDAVLGLPGPAPALGDPPGLSYYEIPIAIQDRSFNSDGSLFYPSTREFFDGFAGPYAPASDIAPIWNPEFFGNTMVVNGKTWPILAVEQRRYRLRFLNGCNSRFLILKMVAGDPIRRPGVAALPFWQIGTEGGFLPAPVMLETLLVAPAERADVVVDFTGLPVGTEIYLINKGPDEPFGGGVAGTDFPWADPDSTGQVMKFTVVPRIGRDTSLPPAALALPGFTPLGVAGNTRQLSLNEEDSMVLDGVGPRAALLGTLEGGLPAPKMWRDLVTEAPTLGSTELWEIYNFTMDAHPIHVHQVMFQVVNREAFALDESTGQAVPSGAAVPPETWEGGFKDTVIAYPGQITRIRARFDLPGLYVWHCHIVEHEDNEMMRPFYVGS